MATRDKRLKARFAGPGMPFQASVYGTLGPRADIEVVYASIVNILMTEQGTIPYNPGLGSMVPSMLMEPMDEVTLSLIRYYANKALTEQEPRIVMRGVRTVVRDDEPHNITMTVSFSIVGDSEDRVFSAPVSFAETIM